jgi:O-antigen/teichoic acid export membrane protein
MRVKETGSLTVDERSFRNPKLREALLISYKTVADLVGKGALFAITVFAARRLAPEAFGVFSLGSTLGWMVGVASDFGIQLHLARAVARQPQDAARLLATWLRVRLWLATGATASVAIVLAGFGWPASFAVPIAVLALVYAVNGLVELLYYFYRGLSRSDVESSLTLWQRSSMLVCGVIALALWPNVTALALAMLLPAAVTLAASTRIATRLALAGAAQLRDTTRSSGAKVSAGTNESPRIVDLPAWPIFKRDIWPIGAGIVLSALYFRIDVFLVQFWSGTELVALYNAVFRLVEALRLFPAAVIAVALPSLCRAGDLRPLVRVAVPITACAAVAAAALWAAAGVLVPFVYGAPYAGAVAAFRILLLSFPLMSLNLALTHQLIGWHGERAYAVICAVALVANVAINARLIPAWSIEGAAWATLGTEALLTAGCLVVLWSMTTKLTGAMTEHVVMG